VAADARRQRGRQGTYLLDWLIRLRHPRPPKTWVVARARQRGRADWDENDAGSPTLTSMGPAPTARDVPPVRFQA
jgi:hypothetical protein